MVTGLFLAPTVFLFRGCPVSHCSWRCYAAASAEALEQWVALWPPGDSPVRTLSSWVGSALEGAWVCLLDLSAETGNLVGNLSSLRSAGWAFPDAGIRWTHSLLLPAMQKTQVQSQGREDPWRREWLLTPAFSHREFRGQRGSVGHSTWSCRVGHDWVTNIHAHTHTHTLYYL